MSTNTTENTLAEKNLMLARLRHFVAENGALLGLIVLIVMLAIIAPSFRTVTNMVNIGIQASVVAVMAFGMTFVIVTAGIDLSVGSVAALSAMVSAVCYTQMGIPSILTVLLGLVTGLVAGACSGAANAFGKLPSFIATLAMLSIARGLTLVISEGRPVATSQAVNFLGGDLGWIPVPILVLIVAGLIAALILNRTAMGRAMYAVGGNMEAARLSGIPVRKVLLSVYSLSGLFAGTAGLILAGRLTSATPQACVGYELDAIAAVVIGGASLAGGVGKVYGTLVGALLLAVIRNGLNLLNVSSFWQQVVIGLVIALAVGIDVLRRKEASH